MVTRHVWRLYSSPELIKLKLETSLEQPFPFESFKHWLNSHFVHCYMNAFRALTDPLFSNRVRVGRIDNYRHRSNVGFMFHDQMKCPTDLLHVTTPSCTRKFLHIVPFPSYSLFSLSSLYSWTGAEYTPWFSLHPTKSLNRTVAYVRVRMWYVKYITLLVPYTIKSCAQKYFSLLHFILDCRFKYIY
jgi:hypothetical protein